MVLFFPLFIFAKGILKAIPTHSIGVSLSLLKSPLTCYCVSFSEASIKLSNLVFELYKQSELW